MQVKDSADALRRAIKLVKPGGWLVLEEPDIVNYLNGDKPVGPGMTALMEAWLRIIRSYGADPAIGRHVEDILKSSGEFSELNVRRVQIPYHDRVEGSHTEMTDIHTRAEVCLDPGLSALGKIFQDNAIKLAKEFPQRFSIEGITPEVASLATEELQDPEQNISTDMYFVTARKRSA